MAVSSASNFASWIPAIGVFAAALVTAMVAFLLNFLQHRREKRSAAKKEVAGVYGDLLVGSFNLPLRAQLLRSVAQLRSGLTEGPSTMLGLQEPIDPLRVTELIFTDMQRLNNSWSRVWAVGSQEAIDAADRLVAACGEYVDAATARSSHKPLAKFILGDKWTPAEQSGHDTALKRVAAERVAFAKLMRNELGKDVVEFALERAERERQAAVSSETSGAQDDGHPRPGT